MGNTLNNKYHISENGTAFRINDDGSFTELGNVENIETKDPLPKIKKYLFISLTISIIIGIIIFFLVVGNNSVKENNEYSPVFNNKAEVINFIENYYNSLLKGDAISYFGDKNITFFDLVNVNKINVQKRIQKIDKNVKWDFDWSTLEIKKLSSDAMMLVYSFDYHIYKGNYTSHYRITSEMIINIEKKIISIRDLQTNKQTLAEE